MLIATASAAVTYMMIVNEWNLADKTGERALDASTAAALSRITDSEREYLKATIYSGNPGEVVRWTQWKLPF